MADKDPATAAAEAAAKELVKVAYGDLLQPAAREVGAELHEFVRAIMVAGRGFGYLIRETYEPFVLRALESIPHQRRVPPPPPLLGRILEGISYEPSGTPLHEMFERLLSTSMDRERIRYAHPSFPVILSHLCSDEVRLLQHLNGADIIGEWTQWQLISDPLNETFGLPADLLEAPDAFEIYYANLVSLSLVIFTFDQEYHEEKRHMMRSRQKLTLQGLGRHLMHACSAPT